MDRGAVSQKGCGHSVRVQKDAHVHLCVRVLPEQEQPVGDIRGKSEIEPVTEHDFHPSSFLDIAGESEGPGVVHGKAFRVPRAGDFGGESSRHQAKGPRQVQVSGIDYFFTPTSFDFMLVFVQILREQEKCASRPRP